MVGSKLLFVRSRILRLFILLLFRPESHRAICVLFGQHIGQLEVIQYAMPRNQYRQVGNLYSWQCHPARNETLQFP